MTTQGSARSVDYRVLMKKVEKFVDTLALEDEVAATIEKAARGIVRTFRDELGITGGRLYRRDGEVFELELTFPEAKPVEDISVEQSYPPLAMVLQSGAVYMRAGDPGSDLGFEADLGVDVFAAISVGGGDWVLAFDVDGGGESEEVLLSLSILRHALNQQVRQERMAGVFDQARMIQASILPRRRPDYGPFEIYGLSEPMESVGGDFYDFIPITDKILGLAIADVSGHGLPAALQVRDIYTGLRMGLARDFKIVRTVERLNGIIHESTLTSRFVSMFYGELELSGLFIYVNAGHPAPFRLKADGEVEWLRKGGAVLGPLPGATYERGFLTLSPGDVLVMFTDGIVETLGNATSGDGAEEFGAERILEVASRHRGESAEAIARAIFVEVKAFSGQRPPEDDRTVLVIRFPEESSDAEEEPA